MIVYIDASALVKRYVAEAGSTEVGGLIGAAKVIGTAVITRVEVAAAFAKAVRMRLLLREEAASALEVFNNEWENFVRIQMTEVLISRASALAWDHSLRGYDAVQLACAIFWQDMLGEPVVTASFDRQLWEAARAAGLRAWPESLY